MKNKEFDIKDYILGNSQSKKDYFQLIRVNLRPFITISLTIFIAAIAYAVFAPNIYKSTVTLKITDQQEDILQSSKSGLSSEELDRFIANEIKVMDNYDTRAKVAKALVDTIENTKDKSIFSLMILKDNAKGTTSHKTIQDIVELLKNVVKTEQTPGTDIVEISAESPSPEEAAIIANTYADQYKELNLKEKRQQLTAIRQFLEKQSKEKLSELNNAEDSLANFKERGKIVALDAQSTSLISQLSQLDAERDAAKIDMMTSNEILDQYKKQISDQDPHLANYLENQTSQAYIDVLQKQLADLQMNRDMAMASKRTDMDVTSKIKDYDRRIDELKGKLSAKINEIKTGAFAGSPEQVKDLTQKMIEEEIRNHALSIKLDELQRIIGNYEGNLDKLPRKSMEFGGYERNAESLQQLYSLVEQKYQQAVINELSQPGNVFIIGAGRAPDKPAKPLRILIALIGLIAGFAAAFGFILIKDRFDDTVKSPYDIKEGDFKLLTWIPHFEREGKNGFKNNELIVMNQPRSAASESFKTLRVRIQTAGSVDNPVKSILVTSPGEGEGKTMVALNLAYSLAQTEKKTLLIDADLRKPRLHKIMKTNKVPGLVELLVGIAFLEEALRKTDLDNLFYINAGILTSDSTKLIGSKKMEYFVSSMRSKFDFIILDSAPIVPVVDSEILAKFVDGILLVVASQATESELMSEALDLIKDTNTPLLGTVLNNFKNKIGYNYYHKYHYNYPAESIGNGQQ